MSHVLLAQLSLAVRALNNDKFQKIAQEMARRVESQEDGLISCFGNRDGIKKREQPAHQREKTLVL